MADDDRIEPKRRTLPVDKGWAWVVLASCSVASVVCSMIYSVGIFNVIFLEVFELNKQTTAWLGAVQVATSQMTGPLTAQINKYIGTRLTVIAGALIGSTGFFLAFFTTSFTFLFLTFGVVVGTGCGIAYLPCMVAIGDYFDHYRNTAYGVVTAAIGAGTMLLPTIVTLMNDRYGWRGCMLIMSGINLHVVVVGMVFMKYNPNSSESTKPMTKEDAKRTITGLSASSLMLPLTSHPSLRHLADESKHSSLPDLSLHKRAIMRSVSDHHHQSCSEIPNTSSSPETKDGLQKSPLTLDSMNNKQTSGSKKGTFRERMSLFAEKNFILYCLSNFFINSAALIVYMHFPAYFRAQGATPTDIFFLMCLLGACSIICRLLMGATTNSSDMDVSLIYLSSTGITGLFVLFCPQLSATSGGRIVFAVAFGFYGNAYCALMAPLALELFPLKHLSMVFGFGMLLNGLGGLIGPPFAGWLFDLSGDYRLSFWMAGVLYIVGACLIMVIPLGRKQPEDTSDSKPNVTV